MPESLQSDAVADMIISTLKDLGRPDYNEIVSDYQSYPGYIDLLRRKQKQVPGYGVNRQVLVSTPGNAQRIGAYATMNLSAGDSLKTITTPRRLYATGYVVDEYLLAQNQHSPVQPNSPGRSSRLIAPPGCWSPAASRWHSPRNAWSWWVHLPRPRTTTRTTRDRHRRARHDPRSRDGADRSRRASCHARRYRRVAADGGRC